MPACLGGAVRRPCRPSSSSTSIRTSSSSTSPPAWSSTLPGRGGGHGDGAGRGRGPAPEWEHRRIFVVHRLDRDTSGVMMFALSSQAAQNLQAQLRVHTHRAPLPRAGQRRFPRGGGSGPQHRPAPTRSPAGGPRPGKGGQTALTTFTPIRRLGIATLVEANLGTGRTHQVRVHLSYLGHPVLGDSVYGDPRKDPSRRPASPCTPRCCPSTIRAPACA